MSARRVILEEGKRLSESLLWTLQRRFFEVRKLRAWSEGVVPHYVSSHPFLARAYGRLAVGYLRDERETIDPHEPIYCIELGAGSGRLGFHFLRQTLAALRLPALRDLRLKYVMTDFAPGQVDELAGQAAFRPWIEEGLLDFARFDAEAPAALHLLHANTRLAPGTLANPALVVANYVFDSIPQDVFRVEDGTLCEALVTLSTDREAPDLGDPDLLPTIRLDASFAPVAGPDVYGEPALDGLLEDYRDRLAAAHLPFPCAALRCLDFFRRLTGDRLLLLSADKGFVHEESLLDHGLPGFAIHGSLSMQVNYHALALAVRRSGGTALHAERRLASLCICALAPGRSGDGLAETRHAFAEAVEAQGPDDFFSIKKGMEQAYATLTADQALAYLRFSGGDANIFLGLFPRLMALAPGMDDETRRELCAVARRVWEMFLPIGEERDVAFHLGLLLACVEQIPAALDLFTESLRLYGPDAATLYNVALCHHRLHRPEASREAVEQALALEPGHPGARRLHLVLQGEPATTATGGPPP
ncbi:MAG TPA: hypothetical protein DD490_19970 [Acidobacteria bacterium]|nr:hypothetical protein [Acidobacteriota bacterium]